MADGFDQNKTEAPTPRRREKAREEGQVVYSPDLNGSVTLLIVACGALWLIPSVTFLMQESIRQRILTLDGTSWSVSATVMSARWLVNYLWVIAGGVSIAFLGISLVLSQVQTGFLVTIKPLNPNWEKLDPWQGMQRVWSIDGAMRGLLAMLKVLSLLCVAAAVAYTWNSRLMSGSHGSLEDSVALGWRFLSQLMMWLAASAFLWGASDYGFKWFRHEQKLKMSRDEVKDEMKDEQGDPHVRARVRRLQKEAALRKSLKDVPKASVVLTNPTHFAVALRYESGAMKAPMVVAKGSGAFARRIADTARKHGVPVLERKPLARALFALAEVGKEIPLEFYRAVAEVLSQVYRLKKQ